MTTEGIARSPQPVRDPWWIEALRGVPLVMLVGFVGGVFGWGVRYATFTASSEALVERVARLETSTTERLARLETAMTASIARLESQTNTRFEAFDKRGDARMSGINARFDSLEKRDEAIGDALNRIDLRLTRIETLREFTLQNGTGARR